MNTTPAHSSPAATRIPVREGLLSANLDDLASVRLMGSRCAHCQETTLGTSSVCPNCGGSSLQPMPLGQRGTLYSYTIVRHKPPGDYKGPDPFIPFAMGLVELPEGIRVLAPLEGPLEGIKIGMGVRFRPFVRSSAEQPPVVTFAFSPA
jgi:uncharacterized OB-fold protein